MSRVSLRPDDTAFVTPNSDTPYSFIGLDLRAEPMVMTIPPMEKNRYFVFQMMDLYTFNFDYLAHAPRGTEAELLVRRSGLERHGTQGNQRRSSARKHSS